jgi:hypothetical protein
MNQDLDTKLCTDFPKIFRDRNAPMTQTCMCWGFDHGDGWYNIIRNACSLIQSHIDWTRNDRARTLRFNRALRQAIAGNRAALMRFYSTGGRKPSEWFLNQIEEEIAEKKFRKVKPACPQVVATQIKEKFGTLRFYYNGGDDMVDGVVRMAEAMSAVTCETCGNEGKTRSGGWIRTLCDEHEKAYQERNGIAVGDDNE